MRKAPAVDPHSIRLLLADDHEIVRRGVRAVLELEQPNWIVIGEAIDGREAVLLAKKFRPDIVVMDISMPDLNGLEAIKQIRIASPKSLILALTIHSSEELMQQVIRAGAHGYLLKSDAARDLVAAVHSVLAGKPFFTARAAKLVLSGFLNASHARTSQQPGLSAREREVIQLIAEGKSTKEIAVALGVSVHTAETHRAKVMQKLELTSIAGLTRYAIRNRIVDA